MLQLGEHHQAYSKYFASSTSPISDMLEMMETHRMPQDFCLVPL